MTRVKNMQRVADKYTKAKLFSGMEWHVEAQGSVLAQGQSGHADAEGTRAIPKQALYRLYSMTKPIVSVLALMLIEQNKLRLFDLLPSFDKRFAAARVLLPSGQLMPAQRPVMVEDLLTHRAGFTYEFITGCHIAPLYQANEVSSDGRCSLDEMMRRVAELPLAFHPGSQFRYSVATDVLAHVIERATDRPVSELLQEYLFEPLNMQETTYHLTDQKLDRLMPMYGVADISEFAPLNPKPQILELADVAEMYPTNNAEFCRGGHGLYGTMEDYAKFARMLLSGKTPEGKVLVSRKMLDMMRANRIPPNQLPITIGMNAMPGYGWGLGVRVMADVGQALGLTGVGEFGWAGAASTYFWVDPAEDMIGLVMAQYLGSMLPLADDMRTAAYQMLE